MSVAPSNRARYSRQLRPAHEALCPWRCPMLVVCGWVGSMKDVAGIKSASDADTTKAVAPSRIMVPLQRAQVTTQHAHLPHLGKKNAAESAQRVISRKTRRTNERWEMGSSPCSVLRCLRACVLALARSCSNTYRYLPQGLSFTLVSILIQRSIQPELVYAHSRAPPSPPASLFHPLLPVAFRVYVLGLWL